MLATSSQAAHPDGSVAAAEPSSVPRSSLRALDVLVLWIVLASLTGVVLLWTERFGTAWMVCIGTLLTIGALAAAQLPVHWELPRWHPLGAAALVLGGIARVDRFAHLSGGQDQGLYTNMAIEIARGGSLRFTDRLRSRLVGDLLQVYDRFAVIGVDLVDRARSVVTINFYPLHPIWMAVVGSVAGQQRQTWSLLLFSWLGIVLAMGIAAELAPGTRAPLIVALLAAVNPAMAFFAKFPVSEIVAGTFALGGFHYLLRACGAVVPRVRVVYACIAVCSFGALCFVRFQLFLYLPFFTLLLLLALTRYLERSTRQVIAAVVLGAVALLGISLVYYQREQPMLYSIAMASIRPHVTAPLIGAAVAGVLLTVGAYSLLVQRGRWHAVRRSIDVVLARSGVLLLLAFAASVPSILQLQRTGRLTPWDYRVDHTTDDWLVRYSVLWKFMLMATPVGFLVLLSLAARRSPSRRVGAAILLLASCWAGVLLQPYVPYLYYYGRYVVADLLPLALILCAVVIAGALRRGRRALGITVVALMVACSAPFALLQVGHLEGERVGIAAELARRVGPQDVVVFAGPDDRVTLPLKVAYDRQLAVIPQSELGTEPSGFLLEDLYDLVASVGGRTFLALRHPSTGPGARLEIQGDFTMGWFSNTEHWRDQTFQSSSRDGLLLPSTARETVEHWYVYEIEPAWFERVACVGTIDMADPGDSSPTLAGFGPVETGGRWISGRAEVGCVPAGGRRPSAVQLTVASSNPSSGASRLSVSIDGTVVGEAVLDPETTSTVVRVPVPAGPAERMVITLTAPGAPVAEPSAGGPSSVELTGEEPARAAQIGAVTFEG